MHSGAREYAHPQYQIMRECRFDKVQNAASLSDIALFRSRVKVLVHAVYVYLRSAGTLTGDSIHITRSAATIASATMTSASGTGDFAKVFTLTTNNTLATITEIMAVRFGANDTGEIDVIYEYEIMPEGTILGG